ncbi:MAG: hypothetical protein JJU37_04040 [Balneolaceae bacterium]|nr:hypothetical protein [Balneolaceae bacterium]
MTPEGFLSTYDPQVFDHTMNLRKVLHKNLPDSTEQVDLSAKMIGYCYSQKYVDLIYILFPSKYGVKLSFNHDTIVQKAKLQTAG